MLLNQVEVGDGQAGGDGRGQRRSPCHPGPGWAEQEDPVQASLSLQDLPALGLADPAVAPERGDVVGALGRSTGFGETKDNCTWSAIARTRRVAPGHQRHDYTSQGFIRMMASTFQLPPNLFSSITVYKINRLQGIISLSNWEKKRGHLNPDRSNTGTRRWGLHTGPTAKAWRRAPGRTAGGGGDGKKSQGWGRQSVQLTGFTRVVGRFGADSVRRLAT